MLGGQVVNQAKRIFHVAARKIRLVFDDLTTVLHEPELGVLNVVNRDFENRSKRRTSFNKKIDMSHVQADHVGFLIGDLESELLDVENSCFLRIICLNQDVCAYLFVDISNTTPRFCFQLLDGRQTLPWDYFLLARDSPGIQAERPHSTRSKMNRCKR